MVLVIWKSIYWNLTFDILPILLVVVRIAQVHNLSLNKKTLSNKLNTFNSIKLVHTESHIRFNSSLDIDIINMEISLIVEPETFNSVYFKAMMPQFLFWCFIPIFTSMPGLDATLGWLSLFVCYFNLPFHFL